MTQQKHKKFIVLASASPRRREILAGMGATFEVMSTDADEQSNIKDPAMLTMELARRKAEAALEQLIKQGRAEGAIVIAADTVVACNGEVLGKPSDVNDARRMLKMLSGNTHTVATGIAVAVDGKIATDCSVTSVKVDEIPQEEIEKYIRSGEPFDKAGAYGIQGGFSKWVRGIDGCYFGVVGLSSNVLARLFREQVGCYPDEIK